MKIYISVDMEGLAGISNWTEENEERERFRRAMNQQVEWVLEGIQASSRNEEITQITIADSHGGGSNLSYDRLSDFDRRVYLVNGSPRPYYMMAGLDESYDMVFFVGYHAGAGELAGAMDHTYSGKVVHNFWLNGQKMNEATLNAGYAAACGVPVGLVIGDAALGRQLLDDKMMPWVNFVCTKEALGRFAGIFRPKEDIRRETVQAVQEVLDREPKSFPLYPLEGPFLAQVELTSSSMADCAALIPGSQRVDGRTVALELDDYKELFNGIIAICKLAGSSYC